MTEATGAVAPPADVIEGSLGILGGTFDPIHLGHLAIAEEARETLGLERVLLVPAAHPPHKPGRPITDAGHRLAMAELAVAGNPAFAVSPMEIERGGPSYTVDTLAELRTGGDGAAPLWFILSTEALAGFTSLARAGPDPRARPARGDAAGRGRGASTTRWVAAHFPGREDRVRFLAGPLLPISGSVVRRRVAAGRSIRYLVPDPVARYIADHALYTEPA